MRAVGNYRSWMNGHDHVLVASDAGGQVAATFRSVDVALAQFAGSIIYIHTSFRSYSSAHL